MNYDMTLSLEFMKAHPLDAVHVLEQIPLHNTASFMERVPPDIAAKIIKMMDSLTMIRCLELMEPDTISAIAENLPLEIGSMILRKIDSVLKDAVMKTLSPEIVEPLNLMLRFPEGTAGALMDPRYFVLPQDIRVKEAVRRVRYHLKQNTAYIYVVNRDHVLLGFINMHEMLHLDPKTLISTTINTDIWKLSAYSDRQAILMNPGWRKFHTLPVVDEKGIFLGAIDYQTIRRLEQEIIKPIHQSPLNETAVAMGELFWVGLSGLVKGAASAISRLQE
jgi:magnesium transporter